MGTAWFKNIAQLTVRISYYTIPKSQKIIRFL